MIVVEKLGYSAGFERDLIVDDGVALERWRTIAHDEWHRMFLDEWARPLAHVDGDGVLVRLVRVVDDREDLWIGFEWVPRVALRLVLRDENARGGLPVPLVVALMTAGVRGLTAVHARNEMVHRDVSTLTLSFALDGGVRLEWRPWGTDEQRNASMTRTAGTIKGSFAAMSPEQVRGTRVTPASDVWSLGVTAWHALTGTNPFRRENDIDTLQAVFRNERGRVVDARADAPEALVALVERMVSSEPERRPTCAEIGATLARELAWAQWDADTVAREVRAVAPRAVDDAKARDERVQAALHAALHTDASSRSGGAL